MEDRKCPAGGQTAKKLSGGDRPAGKFSIRRLRLALTPGRTWFKTDVSLPVVQTLAFLLMAILAQALFTLVGGNLMSFTFLSARHTAVVL